MSNANKYIGKEVNAIIDRPIGSIHPKYPNHVYMLNYGYIPNTISGDGEELDCYILGEYEPLKEYKGICIAVIHRKNDDDDKLIIAPKGRKFSDNEIRVLTEFQEKYFESEIIRNKEDNEPFDIWEEMYQKAKNEYHPEEISPFIQAHHVVAAVQSENGKIYTGFCIEGASGVMNLCAERVAALNMYINSGETKIKRLIAFRNEPPKNNGEMNNGGMPCGACREFLMQLSYENRNTEIIIDYKKRKTVLLKDLIPNWWGDKKYNKK